MIKILYVLSAHSKRIYRHYLEPSFHFLSFLSLMLTHFLPMSALKRPLYKKKLFLYIMSQTKRDKFNLSS